MGQILEDTLGALGDVSSAREDEDEGPDGAGQHAQGDFVPGVPDHLAGHLRVAVVVCRPYVLKGRHDFVIM